jgi:glycosyltransferase involved in cell wall biosynthesis
MNNKDLVSVVVPNYNYARFLPQRMESILNQTYQNLEVIILDDCSTDNSKEVIEKYRSHPKVTHIVYNRQNSGSPFVQWYKGINLAQGELIWIAESDDYAELNFLEKTVGLYSKNSDISFIYTNLVVVDVDGIPIEKENENHCHNRPATKEVYSGEEFIRERMTDICLCNASSVVFSKEKALSLNRSFMHYKAAGDYLFWIMMAEKGNVIKMELPLDYFRHHKTNVTPTSYKNGTTLIELYSIFKYLVRRKHLKGKEALNMYLCKLEQLKANTSLQPDVKKKVLHKWDSLHMFNKYVMAICWRIIR